jgi:hypothetical protein
VLEVRRRAGVVAVYLGVKWCIDLVLMAGTTTDTHDTRMHFCCEIFIHVCVFFFFWWLGVGSGVWCGYYL